MLAYAAQGLSEEGGQAREFLTRAAVALSGLAGVLAKLISREKLEPPERYGAFLAVLDRDARDALAAVELVLAQPAVNSQLVDNLNASIHLRALLTDLFLIDEVLKGQPDTAKPSTLQA
jgi:DNA polymerase III delta prime subunit